MENNTRANEPTHHVLVLDDNQELGLLIKDYLQQSNHCEVTYISSEDELWPELLAQQFDILFLDYRLQATNGLDILASITKKGYAIPTVMMTGEGNEQIAAKAIQNGAFDYLVKGEFSLTALPPLIQKAVRQKTIQKAVQSYLDQIRYQALLLTNMRDAVVVWDLNGTIIYWNSAAEKLYRIPSSNAIGKNAFQIFFPNFEPAYSYDIRIDGESHQLEHQYFFPNGEINWVSAHISVLRHQSKPEAPIGIMDVSRDISTSKQIEVDLRQSEARYRAIVDDHQTEMICRFTPDTILTFANEAYCSYYHLDRDRIMEASFLSGVSDDHQNVLMEKILGLSKQSPVVSFEHQVELTGQTLRWQEWTCRAIFDFQDNVIEFQAVGKDISERKKMEEAIAIAQTHLTQNARMASIGELASGVAHQISNPLTTIIADAQLLNRSLEVDHPGRESADAILKAGWRAQSVINELMKFSQPNQGNTEDTSINQTIESALLLASARILSTSIYLLVNLSERLPLITANPRQLTDVWVNMLLLARSSITDTGKHTIEISSNIGNTGDVFVVIKDDGQPIPQDQLDRVFEPQLIPRGFGRGTGLELSICHEIIRQNNGGITVSQTDNNTCFTFRFHPKDM